MSEEYEECPDEYLDENGNPCEAEPEQKRGELKPCPFCGESVELDYSELPNRKHWFITCECCGMMYQSSISQRKYVKVDWNNRPIEDALRLRIAELEAEVTELKPYRDGYDAYEDFPEEGENVIANLGSWLFLAQRRGDKWYDSLGQQAEIRGGVERWWKLPEVTE